MKTLRWFCTLGLLFLLIQTLYGDGKFYVLDKTPIGVPYQRALILHDGSAECLILQSEYLLPKGAEPNIAWVVPVPEIPELAALDSGSLSEIFWMLSFTTRPSSTSIGSYIELVIILTPLLLSIVGFYMYFKNQITNQPQWVTANRKKIGKFSCAGLIVTFILGFVFMPTLSVKYAGLKVLKHEQVGVYDIHVIMGTDPNAVFDWLKEGNFHFEEKDKAVFEDYIKKDWYFVTAKVNPHQEYEDQELVNEGLVSPLVLKFETPEPIYPLALTSTVGQPTEILLYVVGKSKYSCDDRLNLAFFDKSKEFLFEDLQQFVKPAEFMNEFIYKNLPYMTKFRGTLDPEQMKEDLVFTEDPNHKPYREHVIVW